MSDVESVHTILLRGAAGFDPDPAIAIERLRQRAHRRRHSRRLASGLVAAAVALAGIVPLALLARRGVEPVRPAQNQALLTLLRAEATLHTRLGTVRGQDQHEASAQRAVTTAIRDIKGSISTAEEKLLEAITDADQARTAYYNAVITALRVDLRTMQNHAQQISRQRARVQSRIRALQAQLDGINRRISRLSGTASTYP
jgi:predicted  nucleic acid-binding Zn-ribbon protein